MKTQHPHHLISIAALFCAVLLSTTSASAQTIDPDKPLPESLKPDILYFSFDEVEGMKVPSGIPDGAAAAIREAKGPETMDGSEESAALNWPDGPREAFKKAIEFNRGEAEESAYTFAPGKFLIIPDNAAPGLVGQSFTMGAWVKFPGELGDLPEDGVRDLLVKGCDYKGGAGFHWFIQKRGNYFWASFRSQPGGEPEKTIDYRVILKGVKVNQWNHVALSFDVEGKMLTFYLNGKPIGEPRIDPSPVGGTSNSLFIGDIGPGPRKRMIMEMDDLFIVSGVHDFEPVTN